MLAVPVVAIFATCARLGDGGAKGTTAGARQRAYSDTFSRVWRRGRQVSVVRRGDWRANAVARQPNLGLTKVRAAILREWRRSRAKPATLMGAKIWKVLDAYIGVLEPLSLGSA